MKNPTKVKLIIFFFGALIALVIFSFFTGSFELSFKKAALWICGYAGIADNEKFILIEVRMPRIIMAVTAGAVLAAGGVSMQAVFKNPIVSPFVIGISSGASLGAAIAIVYFKSSPVMIELMAFAGAITAFLSAYALSGAGGGVTLLLLFGVVVSSLCQSIIGLLQYFADTENELPALTFWMLGGLDSLNLSSLFYTFGVSAVCLAFLYSQAYKMNLLALNDFEAASLGINVPLIKFSVIFFSALMVSACTSKVGVIGWIGLTTPHMARIVLGADNRFVFIFASILGALFLLAADSIVRMCGAGEIPVGIVTSAIGAPVFACMLLKYKKTGWH